MTSSIVFCQGSSNNGYPKTVTGVVDFGSGTYSVFTQEQKKKIVEVIMRLDDCVANAIADSIIISKLQEKETTDSVALSLCETERDKNKEKFDLCMLAIDTKQEELDKKQIELQKSERKHQRQKIGTGVGTGVGVVLGFVAGYFGAKAQEKLGQ